jgi:enoyl-CoA hydratase
MARATRWSAARTPTRRRKPALRYETILYEVDAHIATITLNRPRVRNAQNTALILELDAAMQRAAQDSEVRVIILAAAGPAFSAGHDLKAVVGQEEPDAWRRLRATAEGRLRHERELYFDKCLSIYHLPKPTIAQVQGPCVAAGLMLACMCDLIVAADDAQFSNPVLRMTGAGVELLVEPWEIGQRKAKEFLFLGDAIDAREAWRLGLVNRVVPRRRLASATRALARRIAQLPPITASLVKESINHAFDLMGKAHSLKYHFMLHQFMHGTQTAQQALAARQRTGSIAAMLRARDRPPPPARATRRERPLTRGRRAR